MLKMYIVYDKIKNGNHYAMRLGEQSMEIRNTKYMEVADWLRKNIRSNNFKPGERLISEHGLCEKFGISRYTARSAISALEEEGLVVRRQGSGTYINTDVYAGRKNIGVLLTYADDYTFSDMISGIDSVLSRQNHLITLAMTQNKVETERSQLLSLLAADVDGLIVEAVKSALASPNLEVYKDFADRNIPVIFINNYHTRLDCNFVVNDDAEGARIATDFLIKNGHHKIAGIFNHSSIQGGLRYEGFVNKLYEKNLVLDESRIIWYSEENLSAMFSGEQLQGLAKIFSNCTAVLCYSDMVAYTLIEAAPKIGLRIPEDLSIASFDNSFLSRLISPAITTITHPGADMGKLAAESLLRIIQNPGYRIKHVYKPQLIVRDTVRKLL